MSSLCILQLPHTSMSSTTKKIHQSLQLKRHWVCISMSTTTSKTHRVHTSTSTTNSKTHKVHTSMSTTNSKANDPKLALDSHRHVPNHHKDPHHWFSRDSHRLVFNHHKAHNQKLSLTTAWASGLYKHVLNHLKDKWSEGATPLAALDLHQQVFYHHEDRQPQTVTHLGMSTGLIQAHPQPSQRQMT